MSVNKTQYLAKELKKNRTIYERRVRSLKVFRRWFFSTLLAQRVATLASNRHAGLFFSPELEDYLCQVSRDLKFDRSSGKHKRPHSTLHIMSQAYQTGGHTRVVEKWIESSKASEVHSLLLTRKGRVPARLVVGVKNSLGSIYRHSSLNSSRKKAIWMRNIAEGYSKVVLHIHMDDITPTIAFGDGTFKSPIYFYNHADHRFWVGTLIPAQFLEQRTWGQSLSSFTRNIKNSQIVGIPISPTPPRLEVERVAARKRLGINPDSRIILTIGNSKKYLPVGPVDYVQLIGELLKGHPDRILIAVGPRKKDNTSWAAIERKFSKQIWLLPEIPSTQLSDYLTAADLGIDSFPLNGGSVTWEVLGRGVPFLTLCGAASHHDEILRSQFCFSDPILFLDKANEILGETNTAFKEEALRLHQEIINSYGPEAWKKKIAILATNPETSRSSTHPKPDTSLLDQYLVAEAGWREKLLS